MLGKIFINYRRGDDPGFTHALYQRLETEFPSDDLFMDVEGHIAPGDDFLDVLNQQVGQCDVLLAVIGPRWTELLAARSGDPDDFVTVELEAALRQGKRVIPVLVGGASMPRSDQLPEAIRQLSRRNAVALRPERFRNDSEGLVEALKEQLTVASKERADRSAAETHAADSRRRQEESAATQRRVEQAAAAWNAVKDSDDIDALLAFLKSWPDDIHAPMARSRISKLRKQSVGEHQTSFITIASLVVLATILVTAIVVQRTIGWPSATPTAPPATPQAALLPTAGNTLWMLASALTTLVASIPGVAFFYAGHTRPGGSASPYASVALLYVVIGAAWIMFGYSLSATAGGSLNQFIGGTSKLLLSGINPDSVFETFTAGVVIPEYSFILSQLTIACVATALVAGPMLGRTKLSAMLLFGVLWLTLVYVPICHMFWYWSGPSAIVDAAKLLASATNPSKATAEAALDAVQRDAGLAYQWGTVDFAGGAVVFLSAGVAGLICLKMMPERFVRSTAETVTGDQSKIVGSLLLGIAWLGMIAGSNLEANTLGVVAVLNTFAAAAGGGLGWLLMQRAFGRASPLDFMWGAIAGAVAVTPAAGYSGMMGAAALGLVAAIVCVCAQALVRSTVANDLQRSFMIFCIAAVAGIVGTGVVAAPQLGGYGIFDYTTGKISVYYSIAGQVLTQSKAAGLAAVWSAVGSTALLMLLDAIVGLWDESEG